jgi:manganese/zinc/iron transport system permease protein
VLVIALLITPAAAARIWSHRLAVMVPLAGALGALSGWLGSGISATYRDAPAGAVIVLTASAVFGVSMLIAPRRGVLASSIREVRARLTISQHHLLRAVFERLETRRTLSAATPVPESDVRADRHWSGLDWTLARSLLRWRGLIITSPQSIALSEAGLVEAQRLVRAHRLWEQYLISRGGHDALHADLPADLIEHALDPVLVARLEREIADREIPASPHPLTTGAAR